ncbi:MAG: hypothetical protein NWQ46_02475 [Spirosomaceae bacterium]|nr:hypothetical protein [Spirosomataceae bacterium]
MQKKLLLYLFLIVPACAVASGDPFPIGARSWGVGNAVVAMPHEQSFFYNPAGMAYAENSHAFAAYHSRFDVPGLGNAGVGAVIKTNGINIAVGFDQFGDELYNEVKSGIAVARKQGRISLGVKVSYFQATVKDLIAKNTILTEFGIMADIRDNFRIGFHGYNLTGASLFASQNIPTVLRIGFSYQPSKQISLNAEAEKSTLYPLNIKAGIEYEIRPKFFVRTGINSLTNTIHFGTGMRLRHLQFDYAVSSSSYLGLSHHLTVGMALTKKGGNRD